MAGFDTGFRRATFEDVELGRQLASRGFHTQYLKNVSVLHAVQYDLPGLAQAYFRKSYDLAKLLTSHNSITFSDQGWTARKNWAVLASAWGALIFAPLALAVHPLWAAAWIVAAVYFIASSGLFQPMARRRWFYGPLSLIVLLGINCIATAAMIAVAWDYAIRPLSRVPLSFRKACTKNE